MRLGVWRVHCALSDLFSLTRWAGHYIVDMQALRGVIFDICRLGLLSCTGHRLPLSELSFSAPLGLNPICSVFGHCSDPAASAPRNVVPQLVLSKVISCCHRDRDWHLGAQPFCPSHIITLQNLLRFCLSVLVHITSSVLSGASVLSTFNC